MPRVKPGQLLIGSERRGGAHVIALAGELDLATAAALKDELAEVEGSDAERIILDLARLDFIDSAGLRTILTADASSNAEAGRLTLVRGPPRVQRLFDLTGTGDRLPFIDR